MQLADWMIRHDVDDNEMAARLSKRADTTCDRSTVSRYRRKLMRPSWPMIERIKEVTGNKVTADDFVGAR
jgi:hypothetical protein